MKLQWIPYRMNDDVFFLFYIKFLFFGDMCEKPPSKYVCVCKKKKTKQIIKTPNKKRERERTLFDSCQISFCFFFFCGLNWD